MQEELMLPVRYRGITYEFPFRIIPGGYVVRYGVLVNGVELIIDRDDAGEFRATVYDQDEQHARMPEWGLLDAICKVIEQLKG